MHRRTLLNIAATATSFGSVGFATGYKFRDPIRDTIDPILFGPSVDPEQRPVTPREQFGAEARRVTELQRRQTKEDILALRAKYQSPVLGKFRVWELIEKLALCVDPTDTSLGCTNQYLHVCQVTAALEADGALDETMLLTALLHDLGKVAMLAGEPPEHVVCFIAPVEGLEPGGGLENAIFQFGHDEVAYSRFKDSVPEHVAWMLRYHSMILGKAEPFMSAKDHELEQKYLSIFRKYDLGTKSPWSLPQGASLARFRDFIEERFPNPILF
jgi:hypothetical protein